MCNNQANRRWRGEYRGYVVQCFADFHVYMKGALRLRMKKKIKQTSEFQGNCIKENYFQESHF